MDTINLTPEENALLTPFNAAAYDLLRKKAAAEDKIEPCWLVMSDEAREGARETLRKELQYALRRTFKDTSMAGAEAFVTDLLKDSPIVAQWREAELEYKRLRAEGNPRAYFAG